MFCSKSREKIKGNHVKYKINRGGERKSSIKGEKSDKIKFIYLRFISLTQTFIVNKGNAAVLFVEGETALHPETVGAVRPRKLHPQCVRSAVHCLSYFSRSIDQSQRNLRGFVLGVSETGLSTRDNVEFIVGQFQGSMNAHRNWYTALFSFLKQTRVF